MSLLRERSRQALPATRWRLSMRLMCCGVLSGRTLSFQWVAWLQGWTSQGYSKTGRNIVDIFHPISESIECEHILMVIDKTLWIPRERNKNKSYETLQVLQVRHEKIHSCDSFFFATSIHIYFLFTYIYIGTPKHVVF